MSSLDLLAPAIRLTQSDDALTLDALAPLPEPARTVGAWLAHWAAAAPDRTFLAERARESAGGGDPTGFARGAGVLPHGIAGAWRRETYADALAAVEALAGALRDRGAAPDRPVAILSDNSIDHALVALAAMHAAVPVAPISPAYSLVSSTFGRLHRIYTVLDPALVFVDDAAPFARALAAVSPPHVLTSADVAALRRGPREPAAAAGPDTIAKVLFTSGSTGEPKGVINTQRMLTANQESLRACWPFLAAQPPIVVDWLPWSHTFGGNHNFNLVLRNGGTLYIDRGRPAPGLIDVTLRNLAEISPTLWFNVPRGFDQAAGALERDPDLAGAIFARLAVLFYAAAALGPDTRARLEAVAARAGNTRVFFTSAWGSTETAPLATSAHFATRTTGNLGVPVPGVSIKLARTGDRHELRVRGPSVTPGYWRRGGTVEPAALDAGGYLSTGDAGTLVDAARPEAGITFAGRLSENFKLSSGTWVSVAAVRLALVDACAPLLLDAVIAGHDRAALGALLVLSPAAASLADLPARLLGAVAAYNLAHPASSSRITRLLALSRPLSLDDGETTDKGYTNQTAVLRVRADDVRRLFADSPDSDVLALE